MSEKFKDSSKMTIFQRPTQNRYIYFIGYSGYMRTGFYEELKQIPVFEKGCSIMRAARKIKQLIVRMNLTLILTLTT